MTTLDTHQLLSEKQLEKMTSQTIKVSVMGVHYGYDWYSTNNSNTLDERQIGTADQCRAWERASCTFQDKRVDNDFFSSDGEVWNDAKPGNEIASIIFNKRFWFLSFIVLEGE